MSLVRRLLQRNAVLGAGVNYLANIAAMQGYDLATSLLQTKIIKKMSFGSSLFHQLRPFSSSTFN